MASYKHAAYLVSSQDEVFDSIYGADDVVPHSGIYRCEVCGHEIAAAGSSALPGPAHHSHAGHPGEIKWRLIVYAQPI